VFGWGAQDSDPRSLVIQHVMAARVSGHLGKNVSPAQNTRYLYQQSINKDARELSIQVALSDYNAGIYTSLRAVAKVYHIPLIASIGSSSPSSNNSTILEQVDSTLFRRALDPPLTLDDVSCV
jgi:hypothetical protein